MSLFTDLQKMSEAQKTQLQTAPRAALAGTAPRAKAREKARGIARGKQSRRTREDQQPAVGKRPSRDEIQYFSFVIRDALRSKAKVQAEVPVAWAEELDEVCHNLRVGKLELYRYIIGAFLGKTRQLRGRPEKPEEAP